MGSVRNWAARSVLAAAVLLSLALAFLMVIAATILIDLLSEVGALALLDGVPAVAIGGLLFRRRSPHPGVAPQSGDEPVCDEPAIAVPRA